MGINVISGKLSGVKLIEPQVHGDGRGYFMESYNEAVFREAGIDVKFVQDNQSLSKESGVLRGLHYQLEPMAQTKLIRVVSGAIYDVVVDVRAGSPTYGEWEAYELSEDNYRQLLVPAGFAHGFCTLVPDTVVFYKVDQYYSREHDRGILWSDPRLRIPWPVTAPTLSDKDQRQPLLEQAELNFTYKGE